MSPRVARRVATAAASSNPLAPYWRWLATETPEWWNHSIAFGGPTTVLTIDGTRWTVHFNIHATRRSRRAAPYVTAVLSILPKTSRAAAATRIKRGRWVRALGQEVRKYGYFGGWRDSRWGSSAIFIKELQDLSAVKAELARIRQYDLAEPLQAWAGRRTTR